MLYINLDLECVDLKKKGIPIQQPFNFLTIFETLNFNKLIVKLINAKTTVRIW